MAARRRRSITARSRAGGSSRQAPPALSRGVQLLLIAGAVIAVGVALVLGVEMGTPPAAPSLDRLTTDPAPSEPWTPVEGSDEVAREIDAASGARYEPVVEVDSQAEPSSPAESAGIAIRRAPPPPRGARPRLAIVIDDLGRSIADIDRLAAIGVPLTYAVLPFESRTSEVVRRLKSRGEEILLHLPMEAEGGLDPGPGALRRDMAPAEIEAATRSALAAVPGAVGVNNHMGSRLSTSPRALRAILGVLRERGLYYLDSRTTAETLGYSLARDLGLAAGERQVFLDTERDPAAIRHQWQRLLDMATSRGGAIAIAHPYPETLEILATELPRAVELGFEVVTASTMIEPPADGAS